MIVPREYQNEAVIALWNHLIDNSTALLVLPTGTGKTIIFQDFLKKALAAKPDIKACILFNRVKLLRDQVRRLPDIPTGVYCGTEQSWDLSKPVTIASIKSINPDSQLFNLIISDEVHNVDDEKGEYFEFFKYQLAANPKCKIIGTTATPYRYDGYIYGKNRLFKHPVYERPLKYFIDRGYLCLPIAKQPDHQIDVSKLRVLRGEYRQDDIDAQTLNIAMAKDQVTDAINRAQGRKKIVWFCSSINHAILINNLLNQMGEKSVTVHSKMTWENREDAHFEFELNDARHLTFVSVISEGYDYPAIDCVILMRPTKSPTLMMQTIGRGLRPLPEKEDCLILDYANVVSTLGPLEDPVIGRKPKSKSDQPMSMKACPECRTYVPPRSTECPTCGFNWPKAEATKINLTADENANLFKKQIKEMEISNVKLSHYISKSGNKCFRIEYIPKGFLLSSVSEYFTYESDYGWRKFLLRAVDLDIPIKQDPYETAMSKPNKIPKSIEYVMENKYPKIKRIIYELDKCKK